MSWILVGDIALYIKIYLDERGIIHNYEADILWSNMSYE